MIDTKFALKSEFDCRASGKPSSRYRASFCSFTQWAFERDARRTRCKSEPFKKRAGGCDSTHNPVGQGLLLKDHGRHMTDNEIHSDGALFKLPPAHKRTPPITEGVGFMI